MACIVFMAPPVAMATTQFVRVIQHEENFSWNVEPKTEHKPLRMNWVVVTDESGKRQLRMDWVVDESR